MQRRINTSPNIEQNSSSSLSRRRGFSVNPIYVPSSNRVPLNPIHFNNLHPLPPLEPAPLPPTVPYAQSSSSGQTFRYPLTTTTHETPVLLSSILETNEDVKINCDENVEHIYEEIAEGEEVSQLFLLFINDGVPRIQPPFVSAMMLRFACAPFCSLARSTMLRSAVICPALPHFTPLYYIMIQSKVSFVRERN